jgi:hypothetical protein
MCNCRGYEYLELPNSERGNCAGQDIEEKKEVKMKGRCKE